VPLCWIEKSGHPALRCEGAEQADMGEDGGPGRSGIDTRRMRNVKLCRNLVAIVVETDPNRARPIPIRLCRLLSGDRLLQGGR